MQSTYTQEVSESTISSISPETSTRAATADSKSTLVGLVRNLKNEVGVLIQQEIKLAKTEMSEKLGYFTRNGIALAIGGAVAYAGLIVLLLGLGFLAAWAIHLAGIEGLFASFLGLLFIGMLVTGVGGAMVLKGVAAFRKESLTPERTLQTLQDLRGQPAQPKEATPSAPPTEPKTSSAELQARVEATEGEMEETLGELGHRLDPHYLNEQVKHRIQENPYRAGLIAAGAGLLSGLMIRRRFHRT